MPITNLEPMANLRQVADLLHGLFCFRQFRRSTMIHPFDYAANLLLAKNALVLPQLRSGAVVECGTWRGGMSAGLMTVGGPNRTYLFCDSFEGLPPPEQIDGPEALFWARNPSGERYFNNCRASREEFVQTMRSAGLADDSYDLVCGFFDDSLPLLAVPPISVLRLDCDWYRSTFQCLEKFWPHVLPGGLILLDDYYDWAGCRKAVHNYLAANGRPEAICRFPGTGFAHIWKQGLQVDSNNE